MKARAPDTAIFQLTPHQIQADMPLISWLFLQQSLDRNGNIVGDPLLGGIDNQDNYDALMKQIQAVIDADSTDK